MMNRAYTLTTVVRKGTFPHASLRHVSSLRRKRQPFKQSRDEHWFQNLTPWRRSEEVAEMLQENVVFENEHMIAFNKPFGLPMHSIKYTEDNPKSDPTIGDISVNAALPILCKAHSLNLVPVVSQSWHNSGILVFSKSEVATQAYTRYFQNAKVNKVKHMKYRAITIGIPPEVTDAAVYMEKKYIGQGFMGVLVEKPGTKKRQERGKFMSAILDVKVQDTFHDKDDIRAAVIEVNTSATKWDVIPAYLVDKLCAILGENTHAARIKTLNNKPILLAPNSGNAVPSPLHPRLSELLELPRGSDHHVPMHFHCSHLSLPVVGARKRRVIITAPLPDYFNRTLKCLNLSMSDLS